MPTNSLQLLDVRTKNISWDLVFLIIANRTSAFLLDKRFMRELEDREEYDAA